MKHGRPRRQIRTPSALAADTAISLLVLEGSPRSRQAFRALRRNLNELISRYLAVAGLGLTEVRQ